MGHSPQKVALQPSATTAHIVDIDQWCMAANDDSIQCFLKSTLQTMISDNTRELHVEEEADFSRVRVRINGRLTERKLDNPSLASDLLDSMGKQCHSMGTHTSANEDFGELTVPVQVDGRKLDLNICHYKTAAGKSLTLLLNDTESIPEILDQTRLDESARQRLRQHYQAGEAKGATLICSNSADSLRAIFYALLGEVNSVERKVVSLQQRTEKSVPRVSQILTGNLFQQTDSDISISELRKLLSTSATLSDHIFVDWETTKNERFIKAIPGISQEHTSVTLLWHGDVSTGLLNLAAPAKSLCHKLELIVELHDTGLICPHCAEAYIPNRHDYPRLPVVAEDQTESYVYANGCNRCSETGIASMTTLASIISCSDGLRHAINSESLTATHKAVAKAQGKNSIRMQREILATTGRISAENWLKGTS